jgi:hypothetical protein
MFLNRWMLNVRPRLTQSGNKGVFYLMFNGEECDEITDQDNLKKYPLGFNEVALSSLLCISKMMPDDQQG